MSQPLKSATKVRLPSLNALRAFEAVARLGSVSLAGGELSVSPGAVSRHIKGLESDLGIAILKRNGRGVRLTTDGKSLRNNLQPAFSMISSAVGQIRRDPRRRTLLVVAPPVFVTNWLIPRLDRFSRQVPKVDIVIADRLGECSAKLTEADMVVDWGDFESTVDVVAERLTYEEVFPVCVPSICPNGTLAGATLLHRHALPKGFEFPDWPAFLSAVGLEGRVGIDSHAGLHLSVGMILNAAGKGKGMALAIPTVAHDHLVSGRLVRPIVETMQIDMGYWLLRPRAASDRPEVEAFRAWLLDELAGSVGLSKRTRNRDV